MRRLLTTFGALALTGAVAPAHLSTATETLGVEALRIETAEEWYDDFDEAAAVAKREKKDLLVDFTGSDWCGWCIRLDKEVFAHEPFLTAAQSDYVLVKLDFPRSDEAKAKVPNPERNAELQAMYGVRGFPTILLMTPEGQVYGQTGYREGGPEKYVEHLKEERARGTKELERLQAVVAELGKAEGKEHAAKLEKVIAETEAQVEAGSPFALMLAKALRAELREGQPVEQQQNLLRALFKAGQIDPQLLAQAREIDPHNEHKVFEAAVFAQMGTVSSEEQIRPTLELIEALLATNKVTPERELDLRMTAADWYHRFVEDKAAAQKHATRALELAPADNERMIDYLRGILDAE